MFVVGAPQENGGLGQPHLQAGNAYVFKAGTNDLAYTLTSPNPATSGNFGHSVSVGDGLVVVGAPFEASSGNGGAGNAYVYDKETGGLVFTLASPNAAVLGFFGYSVSVGDGSVVVGAPGEDGSGVAAAGRVYVFNSATGILELSLSNPTPQVGGFFGGSVGIWGGTVAVGAPSETAAGQTRAGNAYLFTSQQGNFESALISPNPVVGGNFGYSVAGSGGQVAIGAPRETSSGLATAGNAYVFDSNTGSLHFMLSSPNVQTAGFFGGSVSMGEGRVVVGATDEQIAGQNEAGNAYVFDGVSGGLASTLVSPNQRSFGNFGFSVGIGEGRIVVGAPREGPFGGQSGLAYAFP